MENEELRTVASFGNEMSAQITAGMLRENGIPAQVFGQASSYPSINAAIDSVCVKVRPQDYDAAMQLISQSAE